MRQLSGVEAQQEVSPTILAAAGESGNNKPCVAYTLKIRGGCEVDSGGKAAGKGALVQVDKAATLSTVQDQYLFAPTAYSFDSLASNSMKSSNPHSGCRQVEVAKTLDTTDPNPSKNQGGIAIVEPQMAIMDNIGGQAEYGKVTEINGTLRAGGQGLVCYPVTFDARGNGDGAVVSTLTGDHNNRITDYSSVVVEPSPVYCLQGNGIDRADTAGCNGKGWKEGQSYTLNTIDRPAVVYAVDQGGGKSSANVSENTAPTLCTTHGGEPAVAYGLDRASFNQGQNAKFDFSVTEEQQPTITARGPGAVCCTTGSFMQATEEVAPTLMARDWKDPTCVAVNYIVRRLTPTECARLQGFADRWGDIDEKDSFTPEEYEFWLTVRNTHAAINGKAVKDYTEAQMLTWYNKLQTDSAEYKMWGNGIALPPALYCLQGIVDALTKAEEDDWML